ncbi:unnamed protein product [Rotaria sp. Silwood1]|nr:unnamed protein product [Rotaria sp. Silwood1]
MEAAQLLKNNQAFMNHIRQLAEDKNKTTNPGLKKAADGVLWKLEKENEFKKQCEEMTGSQTTQFDFMISYSWSDKPLVRKIYKYLTEQCNYRVWLDENELSGSLCQAMAQGIEKSKIILLCMSETYKQSESCRNEAEYARARKKTIIPLKMREVQLDDWLGFLVAGKLYINFGKHDFETSMGLLINEIERRRSMEQTTKQTTTLKRYCLFAENKEKLIHSALNTLVDTDTTTNVVDLEFIEDQYLAFRRLLASKAGFQAFTQLPKFRERIGTKIVRSLKLNDDQITYAALEVLNTLLQPMHLDYDLRQEQLNKSSILSTKKFLESLLDIFLKHVKQNTGSLIISSFLDFLTYTLCPPFSETTDGQHFDVLLELVSSNGRIFFKLFQHSSFTIVKGAGSIMKAIIEEGSSDISAHMQDLALSEGALPVHLLRALFTASNDSRLLPLKYLSQQLLGLWATGHPTTFGLLKRIFPLGLIAYLDSNEEPEKDFDEAALLGRDTLRLATEQHAQTNKSNALSTSIINTANKIRNATQMKILEQHVQHAFQHWSLKFKQNSKLLSSSDNPNATGTNISSHSNDKQQPVVLRKPRQRIRAEKNWRLFYQKFVMDHARPTLIWNNKTRDELRETIENEIRNFNIDKDLGHGHLISWNHNEFEVLYQCLNDEIKIGSVYLRLLLEQGELTANNDAATGE